MDKRNGRTLVAILVTLAFLAAGCTAVGPDAGYSDPDSARLHAQAQQYLANFDAAVKAAGGLPDFVPTSDTTLTVGDDWGSGIDGGAAKLALMGGDFDAAVTLPTQTPPDGQIRWPDGKTEPTGVLPAATAFAQMSAAAKKCTDCTAPLVITGATLTTATFETTRGSAVAPAWEFTLENTPVRIDRLAVATKTLSVPEIAWDPNNAPIGVRIESATIDASGMRLTAAFWGAPDGADKPCGEDYTAEAVESDSAVVVIIHVHRNPAPVACTLVGFARTAQVTLANPLGNRAVLEDQTGQPVAVTPAG